MRATILLLLMFASSLLATNVHSQVAKVNISVKNSSVIQVLRTIESQTDYLFVYDKNEIDLTREVNLETGSRSVSEILSEIFSKTNVVFAMNGSNIMLMVNPSGVQQQKTISGKVTDATGAPLPGVSVVIKGTTNGTITDANGNYTLPGVQPKATLQFSFVGMKSQEIVVDNRQTINISMDEEAIGIEEVVAVGYGVQRKESVTGSVASVTGEKLRDIAASNITQTLQGRVAGVEMSQTSSKPGADMQIRIRGTRSLNADNNPLVVLDGIPFAGSISDISSDDIKSIDILKDASSTAIYGSRGANGVIIITTYKGMVGQKAKVSYNGYYGVKTLYHRYPMMTGDELYQLRKDAGVYKDTQGNPTLGADEKQGNNTNWQDLMYDTGMLENHDVGITGGTQTGSYNFGAGVYQDKSLLPGQDYSRISLRANIDQKVGEYIRFGITTNSNYNTTNGQNLGLYNSLGSSPMINPWNEDGTWKTRVSSINDQNMWAYSRDAVEKLDDGWADNQRGLGSYNSLYGEVKIPWIEGLSYRVNVGLNYRTMNRGQYRGMGVFSDSSTANSTGSLEKQQTYQWVVENLLTYDRIFNSKHHVNFTGLYSAEETHTDRSLVSAIRIPADFFQYWNLGQADKADVTVDPAQQRYQEWALQSVMGRLMYDFNNRYMISVAVRSDGSSRLAPGHKWHTYPAISAGWNIAQENFMQSASNIIDNLKLRLGWGQTSNQAISPYATLGNLSLRPYNYGTTTGNGAYVSGVPNENLGWEYSSAYNIGLDFSLLKNRLSGSVESYFVDTNDLLMQVNLPSTSGVASYWANIGKSQNRGFELALNGTIIKTKDWKWDVGLNFYTNKNKIKALASGTDRDETNAWFKGYPINSIFDYEKVGLWQTTDPDYQYLLPVAGKTPGYEPGGNAGMIKVKYTGDYNADGSPTRAIGPADRQIISADPDWLGGFNTRVTYKNWDLNVIGTYQHGGILVSSLHAANGYLNMLTGRRGNVKVDYWTPENTGAKYPKPGGIQSGDNQKYGSTLGYFDASYFKVGQITLGYNFNSKAGWFKTIGLSNARLYATVQNAFVLFSPYTKETGLDPVTNSYGNENAAVTNDLPYNRNTMLTVGTNTPQTRNFLVGLNLSF